jgi:hypothetical protein
MPLSEQISCESNRPCACASACALIWFGGVDRWGTVDCIVRKLTTQHSGRFLQQRHQQSISKNFDAIVRYLEEMEVPKSMIETLIAAGSADNQWVDEHKTLERPDWDSSFTEAPEFSGRR